LTPFWFVKLSMSPDCSVVAEIVSFAPVRSLPLGLPVSPESTATAAPPILNVLVVPEGVNVGTVVDTLTCSATGLLSSDPSIATIESDRVAVFVLVVVNVTDCKAVWYCATVAVPLSVNTPPE
jgi:hypothetical protein